jgi:hypothetical protein
MRAVFVAVMQRLSEIDAGGNVIVCSIVPLDHELPLGVKRIGEEAVPASSEVVMVLR